MLADLISQAATFNRILLPSRDALLSRLSDDAARLFGLHGDQVFAAAMHRESEGPTGVEGGIALPHARVWGLPSPRALLVTLARPLDFGGPDGLAADIVVFLLSPDVRGSEHLKALARISRTLRNPGLVAAIRAAASDTALHSLLGPHSPFSTGNLPLPVSTRGAAY